MDGTPPKPLKDRAFEPSKIPVAEAARELVEAFLNHVASLENRQRGRKAAAQSLHVRQATALVLDLAHIELTDPGRWLSVSLKKDDYNPRSRTASFLTESFAKLVTLLSADGTFVDFRKGAQGAFGTGRRSVVRAGSGLRALIEASGVTLSDIGRDSALRGDVIVLKGEKVKGQARKVAFHDTDDTRRMRSEVEEINAWLAEADLWWEGDEVEDRIDMGDRFLRRIFNDGSFDAGGRLFGGFWQRAKSELRLDGVKFGEYSAVALDFGQMAVRTAYSIQRATPPAGNDLYEVPGLDRKYREGIKRVLNALLAADGMPQRFPQGSRKYFPRKWKFADVYLPIAKHHAALKPLFGTSQSLQLMNKESNLLVAILLKLKREGVVALPIHDCLLVSQRYEAMTKSVMEGMCRECLGVEGRVEITRCTTVSYSLGTEEPLGNDSAPLKKGA